VLDITGRYGTHFNELCSPAIQRNHEDAVQAQIAARLNDTSMRGDEAGNVREFEVAIRDLLDRFLQGSARLLLLNPNRFEVSRMAMRPSFNNPNRALMLTRLSMVDVTRVISESLLALVQAMPEPQDEKARVCLVLEEAHSLVPEWNSTTRDDERESVNGTVRAILQGRKYGYGCVLITQRTANVAKSVLNQCNTILGMRVYDATGMGFLENYVGEAHAKVLASLKNRQAVFFGRGSTCDAPIVIQLNDAVDFRDGYWAKVVGAVPITPLFGELGNAAGEPALAVDAQVAVPADEPPNVPDLQADDPFEDDDDDDEIPF
jgi:hypothetical protein